MLCYVMLCVCVCVCYVYVMLCYVMLCYVMLCYVIMHTDTGWGFANRATMSEYTLCPLTKIQIASNP